MVIDKMCISPIIVAFYGSRMLDLVVSRSFQDTIELSKFLSCALLGLPATCLTGKYGSPRPA